MNQLQVSRTICYSHYIGKSNKCNLHTVPRFPLFIKLKGYQLHVLKLLIAP